MKLSRVAVAGIAGAALIGGAALLYANQGGIDKVAAPPVAEKSELGRFAAGSLSALQTPASPLAAPTYVFRTREDRETSLADFRGKVVVLNVWAMWCAPCRVEMPTLATLATAYADADLVVLPVNVDHDPQGRAEAARFIDVHRPLPLYSDPKFQLPFELPGKGKMPQTVLIDRQGRIRAHLSGEADWSGPEARALIDALLAET